MWRAGCRWTAVGLLAALSAGGAAVAAGASPTARSNAQAARSDAASLLASLNLPPGAVRQDGEPAGDQAALAHPVSGPPDTPNAVDDHAWWVVPGTPEQVLQYVEGHPPAGSKPELAGSSNMVSAGFQFSPIAGELSSRALVFEAVSLPNGSTGVRSDSEVVWITPRPRSERIGAGARRLVVTATRAGKLVQGPITVTSRAQISRAIALLNALPAWQPGVRSCPADFGGRIRLAFSRARSGTSPLAVAVVDPTGCGEVQLSLGSRRQPPLAGGYTLTKRLSATLHVRLDTGAP